MPKLGIIFLSRVPSLFCTVCRLIRSLIFPPCAALSSAVCRAPAPTLRSPFLFLARPSWANRSLATARSRRPPSAPFPFLCRCILKRINLPCVRCLTAPCAVASRRESDCRVSSVSRHRVPVHLDAKPRLLVLYRGIHKAASPKHHKLHSAAHAKWHKKRTTRAKKEPIRA